MRRRQFLLGTVLSVLLCVSLVFSAKAEATMWIKTYGEYGCRGFYSLVETSDRGYVIAGTTGHSFLVKTDALGNVEWNRTYRWETINEPRSLIATSDGGYAFTGFLGNSYFHDYSGAILVKTDAYGNADWNKTYEGEGLAAAYSLVETSDGGYALAGGSLLVKTDALGNVEWNRTYGGAVDDDISSLIVTSDGGYAMAGSTLSFGAGSWDFWLVKTDVYGNVEWNKTYGGTGSEEAKSLVATSDGGYALAGGSLLVKTDAYGNMEWNKTYNGSASSLIVTSDGGYALAGQAYVRYYNDQYGRFMYAAAFWWMKTDKWGNMEWNRTTPGHPMEIERAESLVATSDGGYAIVGAFKYAKLPHEDTGGFVIKTDENGAFEPEPAPETPATWPTIDISCKGTATATGLKVEIKGKLSFNGTAISGAPVLIWYSVTGDGPWENLTLVNTGPDGEFSAVWTPPAIGNYRIRAWWEGNATIVCFVKYVNLALTPYSEQSIFSLNSNSTITEFAFNSTSKTLSFTASGPSDTTGYATVYIPKSPINDISDLTVYVDGKQITYNSESQTDSWVLSFTYSHSAHKVVIDLSAAFSSEVDGKQPPDFTIYIVISAVAAVIAVAVAALVFKRKRRHTPTQQQ